MRKLLIGLLALCLVTWPVGLNAQSRPFTYIQLLGTVSGNTVTGVTTGTSIPVNVSALEYYAFHIRVQGSTPGAGTLIIEEASWNPQTMAIYTGTWSPIQTITATSLVGDAEFVAHFFSEATHFVRIRIGTTITTSTVSVVLTGN